MKSARIPAHYQTLRVAPGASADDVRRAYRKLAQKYHPDRHAGKPAAEAVMAQINAAYEILSDPQKRAAYDNAQAAARAQRADQVARQAEGLVPAVSRSSWILVSAIVLVSLTTLGAVTLYTLAPRQPMRPAPRVAVQPVPEAPAPRIEPWKEPAASVRPSNPATDPVTRLVREGVVTPARPTP